MTINRLNQGTTNQVLVKAISGQTTNLLELQDSSGNVVSSIGPTGALGGTVNQPQGLVHIETVSIGSGVSSISVNNVFTSAFTNYKIIYQGVNSNASDIRYRLRAAGTDDTGSNYKFGRFFMGQEGSIAFTTQQNQTSTFSPIATGSTANSSFYIDISNPQKSTTTTSVGMGSGFYTLYTSTTNTSTTSFDGFTLIRDNGTFSSGEIRIYGYKD